MKIFVTVGTHPQQFNRLLKELDYLVETKKIRGEIFAQTGNSDFEPNNISFKDFLTPSEMEQKIKEADIIVSHAGAGSIIGALEQKKPLIVVPRLKKFAEHTNDHQQDLAIAMQNAGKAIAVLEIKELSAAIETAKKFKPAPSIGPKGIIKKIGQFLAQGGKK